MKRIEGMVWCEVHGTVHEATKWPHEAEEAPLGHDGEPLEPECEPYDWRLVYSGRVVLPMHPVAYQRRVDAGDDLQNLEWV